MVHISTVQIQLTNRIPSEVWSFERGFLQLLWWKMCLCICLAPIAHWNLLRMWDNLHYFFVVQNLHWSWPMLSLYLEHLKCITVLLKNIYIKSKCLYCLIACHITLQSERLDHLGQPGLYVHIVQWNNDSYGHSVNWRPSKVVLLQLAQDVAGTHCSCWACGEEYNDQRFRSTEYTPR